MSMIRDTSFPTHITRSYIAERKRTWRRIGLDCLRRGNVKGFHRAYQVARDIRSPARATVATKGDHP